MRNHPVGEEALDRLETYDGERDGRGRSYEKRLAQGDYDVHVMDPRWMEPLRVGDCWDTGNYATSAVAPLVDDVEEWYAKQAERGSMDACFMLRWLRQERGDAAGAAEQHLRAGRGTKPQVRGKALLYLGDLQAGQGEHEAACATYQEAEESEQHEHYASRYRSRAALGQGVLLRRLGREEKAQAAFARALAMDDVDRDQRFRAEVRRLTSAEPSPARSPRQRWSIGCCARPTGAEPWLWSVSTTVGLSLPSPGTCSPRISLPPRFISPRSSTPVIATLPRPSSSIWLSCGRMSGLGGRW